MIPFILAAIGGAFIGGALSKKEDKKLAKGGFISNQYIGKSAEDVWDAWTIQQREHFLADHDSKFKSADWDYDGDTPLTWNYVAKKYDHEELPHIVKMALDEHIQDGEYAKGGFIGKGEMVWNEITDSKKAEFLHKNFTPQITPRTQETLVGKSWNFLPKNVKIKFESEYANVEDYAKGGEIYNTLWYAIKEHKDWDENEQHELHGLTWTKAVKKAKEIANEHKREVRLSTSKGYNNQGHYIYFDYKDGGEVDASETHFEVDGELFEDYKGAYDYCYKHRIPHSEIVETKEFKEGGGIPNNYAGKDAEDVWSEWTKEQRLSFLADHHQAIKDDAALFNRELEPLYKYTEDNYSFDKLPKDIKHRVELHVSGGQYAKGGETKKTKVSNKFVVVSEKIYPEGVAYWTIVSKPVSSKKEAELLKDNTVASKDETIKVVTLKAAKAHKHIIGEEYLNK